MLASTSTFVSCKDYNDDINSLENKLTNEIKAREALQAKVTTAESEIAKLKETQDKLSAALEQAQKNLEAKLAEKENVADHKSDIDALKSNINSLETQLGTVKSAIDKLQKALDDQIKKEGEDVAALNIAIDKALVDAKAYTDGLINLVTDKINALDAKKADKTDVDQLKTDLEKVATNLEQVKKDLDATIAKYNSLDAKLTAAVEEIAKLNTALDAQKAALEQAIKDGDAAVAAEAQKKLDALSTELKKADDNLQSQINTIKDELSKKANKDDVAKSLDDLKKEISETYATNDALTSKYNELIAKIKEINDVTIPEAKAYIIAKYTEDLEVMSTILSNQLRSLVFVPQLYVDGIEAFQYRALFDMDLYKVDIASFTLPEAIHKSWDPTVKGDQIIKGLSDYRITTASKGFWASPAWPIEYHMNPSTSGTKFGDIKGFDMLERYVVNRAVSADLGISVTDKYVSYANGSGDAQEQTIFSNANGNLRVGVKINDPRALFYNGPRATGATTATGCDVVQGTAVNTHATTGAAENLTFAPYMAMEQAAGASATFTVNTKSNHLDNVVALEAYDSDKKDKVITSDYALIQATGVTIEGIVWRSNASSIKKQKVTTGTGDELEYNYNGYGVSTMFGNYDCGQSIHVYDTPEEALIACQKSEANFVCLPWNSTDVIRLEDYLALHYYEQNITRTGYSGVQTWNFTSKTDDKEPWKNLANYGVWYEFETVDYSIDGNTSRDSRFMQLSDAAEKAVKKDGCYDRKSPAGVLRAGNVVSDGAYKDGEYVDEQSKASVGREPLVRVLVHCKDNAGKDRVILDGYILVKITTEPVTTSVEFTDKTTFDLCNGKNLTLVNWSVFNDKVLTKIFNSGYTWDMFANAYGPAATSTATIVSTGKSVSELKGAADGYWEDAVPVVAGQNPYKFRLNLYPDNNGKPGTVADKGVLGEATFYQESGAATNFRIEWKFSAADLEYISHTCGDPLKDTQTYSAWIRWSANNSGAPYDAIWAKLTVTVNRNDVKTYTFEDAKKINNYWWDKTGDPTGFNTLVFDPNEPVGGLNTKNWSSEIWKSLVGNELILKSGGSDVKVQALSQAKYFVAPINKTVVSKYFVTSSGADDTNHKGDEHIASGTCEKSSNRPLTWEIQAGTEYIITAYNPSTNADWNDLVPRYSGTTPTALTGAAFTPSSASYTAITQQQAGVGQACPTVHKWNDEAHANEVVNSCCIDYNLGAYANNFIYVIRKSDWDNAAAKANAANYHKLAILDQANGTIELYHDSYTYAVLNAIGYDDDKHSNIDKELRAMIGIIAKDNCGNAQKMENSVFMASWNRPINMKEIDVQAFVDAKASGNKIYLADVLHLFDWRGYELPTGATFEEKVRGCMEHPETKWWWAYYNVNYTKIDFREDKVMTNLNGTWQPLNVVSPKGVNFTVNGSPIHQIYTNNFSISSYNDPSMSVALDNMFKNNAAFRNQLGYITYYNNGGHVSEFDVKIPIYIGYEWGELQEDVIFHIKNTIGNN